MTKWESLAAKFESIAAHGSMTAIPLACAELCRAMAEPRERIEYTGLYGVLECDGPVRFKPLDMKPAPRPVLHCYAPHRQAIEVLLKRPFDIHLRTMVTPQQMRGIEGGTFAYVTCHPEQVPADMWHMIRSYGWIVLNIDDSYARARAAR